MNDMRRRCTSPITGMFLVLVSMGWVLFTSLAILLCLPLLLCAVFWTQGNLLTYRAALKLKEYESWVTMTRLLRVNLKRSKLRVLTYLRLLFLFPLKSLLALCLTCSVLLQGLVKNLQTPPNK